MRSQASRAALIYILEQMSPEALNQAARLLGYERSADVQPQAKESADSVSVPTEQIASPNEQTTPKRIPLAPTPFWRLVEYEPSDQLEVRKEPARINVWQELATEAPPARPLCPWPTLMPRLRAALVEPALHRDPDIPAIVRRLSNGLPIKRWPRRSRKRWPGELLVMEDFATRLTPLWMDQKRVTDAVSRVLSRGKLDLSRLGDGLIHGTYLGEIPGDTDCLISANSSILVISDLGLLGLNPQASLRRWERFAQERKAEDRRCVALTPAPPAAYPREIHQSWTLVQWDDRGAASMPDEETRRAHAERLLGILSYGVKMPPGLLRDVRRLLPGMSVVTEIDAWQSRAIASPHISAATLDNDDKKDLHRHFRSLSPHLRQEISDKIKQWCGGEGNSIYFEAVVALGALAAEVVDETDLDAAIAFFNDVNEARQGRGNVPHLHGVTSERIDQYMSEMRARTYDAPQEIPELRRAYSELCQAIKEEDTDGLPAQFDPSVTGRGGERHGVELIQRGEQLIAVPSGRYTTDWQHRSGSPLARIETRNDTLAVFAAPFWKSGAAPSWVTEYGRDEFGPWATFAVTGADGAPITLRMRWIAPGQFFMGSPEDEPGRYGEESGQWNEGPQHEVRLSQGYWLFDTPVTQELWTAVMEGNPSHFKHPKRPVEFVSWNDAARFLEALNQRVPGVDLALPTEAQWEYACRAGTTTPNYAGEDKDLGEIAWFFDNSNGQTQPVATKRCNAWGLHDMLGNVREWCADDMRKYGTEAVTDPVGSLSGARRAQRGGSWDNGLTRDVRGAIRYAGGRDGWDDRVGFRCARVRAGAEPAEPGPGRAEREMAPGRRGGAVVLVPENALGKSSVELPKGRTFIVRSDCETLTFAPITRPDWANAMGRDRYGLWAEFTLGEVTQRMRWIRPGRFMMGSPESEEEWDDEGPQHEVRFGQGYWLFDAPVTQALWLAVMGENPSRFRGEKWPVEQVSWDDAQQFLERINASIAGLDLVLPTEAQWEYACRAGTVTPNYAGGAEALKDIAWFKDNSGQTTHPVGALDPNAWGLYDMLGNVWEWCADGLRRYEATSVTDPVGPLDGAGRALRGGSWSSTARGVRAAGRDAYGRGVRNLNFGFRCARVRE